MAATETAKTCKQCGEVKGLSDFYAKAGAFCKKCAMANSKRYKKTKKECAKCNKFKLKTEFSKDPCQKSGLHPYCKLCTSEYGKKFRRIPYNKEQIKQKAKEYHIKNRDTILAKGKIYYEANKTRMRLRTRCHRLGITVEQYKEKFKGHNGNCDICGISEKEFERPLFIDHCHKTGEVRGLLCHQCNMLLGNSSDNLDILVAAYSYLNTIAEKRRAS